MTTDPVLAAFNDIIPGKRARRADVLKEQAPPAGDEWDRKPIFKRLNGVTTEFFTIGHLATALNRRPVTIRSWEDKKILPMSRYRDRAPKGEQVPGKKAAGKRLYTRQQIEVVIAAAQESGVMASSRDANWPLFTRRVVDGWR